MDFDTWIDEGRDEYWNDDEDADAINRREMAEEDAIDEYREAKR